MTSNLTVRLKRSSERLSAMVYDRDRGVGGDVGLIRNGGITIGNGGEGITLCWGRLRERLTDALEQARQEDQERTNVYTWGPLAVFKGWIW